MARVWVTPGVSIDPKLVLMVKHDPYRPLRRPEYTDGWIEGERARTFMLLLGGCVVELPASMSVAEVEEILRTGEE